MRMFEAASKADPQGTLATSALPGRARLAHGREAASMLHLRSALGNQAMQRVLRGDAPRATSPEPDMEGAAEDNTGTETDQELGDDTWLGPIPQQVVPPLLAPRASGPSAVLPAHIRAGSTPAGMPDRIPPRVDTPVNVAISGWFPPLLGVILSIEGAGGGNGSASIDGAATADLIANAVVQLRGVDQTAPGNGGNLRLVASIGGTRLAASAGFSVSSIPQNFSVTYNSQISTATMRGLAVNNHWESDSGSTADLDEAERSEQVEYGAATGIWAGVVGGNNSGYLAATNPPLVDRHGTPLARLTGPGSRVAEQVFTFNDKRTGATDIAARNSGFRLTRTAVANAAGRIEFTVDKRGAATTANGFSSAAAAGSVTRTQVI